MRRSRHLRTARTILLAALPVWAAGAAAGALVLPPVGPPSWETENALAGAMLGSVPALAVLLCAAVPLIAWLLERPRPWADS